MHCNPGVLRPWTVSASFGSSTVTEVSRARRSTAAGSLRCWRRAVTSRADRAVAFVERQEAREPIIPPFPSASRSVFFFSSERCAGHTPSLLHPSHTAGFPVSLSAGPMCASLFLSRSSRMQQTRCCAVAAGKTKERPGEAERNKV